MMRIPFVRSHRSVALAFLAALALACALAIAYSGPARAFPTTASFTAVDFQWGASGGGTTVHIDPGGTVDFAYPSGISTHNADFGGTAPTSCTPSLPASPTAPGWSSTCTFDTQGTYTFVCDLHASMHGTVLVGNVPEPTPPTGGGTGGGGGGYGGNSPTGGGSTGPLASLKISKSQRGSKVRGSIGDVAAGSAVSIEITAKSSTLSTSKSVRVARLVKSGLAAGTYSFAIKLNKKALAVVKKKGKLALSAGVKFTPPGGSVAKATRSVTLKKS
jgi:plastocyanin